MNYIIYKNGKEINRIVADENFCKKHYNSNAYSYKEAPLGPIHEPVTTSPTLEELQSELAATQKKLNAVIQSNAMLESCLVEMAQVIYV